MAVAANGASSKKPTLRKPVRGPSLLPYGFEDDLTPHALTHFLSPTSFLSRALRGPAENMPLLSNSPIARSRLGFWKIWAIRDGLILLLIGNLIVRRGRLYTGEDAIAHLHHRQRIRRTRHPRPPPSITTARSLSGIAEPSPVVYALLGHSLSKHGCLPFMIRL